MKLPTIILAALILSGCAHVTNMTIGTKHSIGDAITYRQMSEHPGMVLAIFTTSRTELGKVITDESYLIRDGATEEEIEVDGRYVKGRAIDSVDHSITRDRD